MGKFEFLNNNRTKKAAFKQNIMASGFDNNPFLKSDATYSNPFENKTTVNQNPFSPSAPQTAQLKKAPIQRYELEGPFNKNNPVHEVLTLMTIKKALEGIAAEKRGGLLGDVPESALPKESSKKAHNLKPEKIDRKAQQFVRGVIWPDDPKGYLFDDPHYMENYSSGLMWYEEFDVDEKDDKKALIARSHYGDLQFFHAMASKDGEKPEETKEKILKWAKFLTQIANGELSGDTKVKDHAYANELFPKHGDFTIKKILGYDKLTDVEVRQRAAGALLHLIQDSHAEGHTGRDKDGNIEQFRSYEHQDHGKHGEKDGWAKGKDLGERIKNTPGAADAIAKGAEVLKMLDQGNPTEDVIKYLDNEIFKLSKDAKKSGPGDEYKKH